MSTEQIVFYAFALIALLSAAGVVLNFRNSVYSALCLVVAMLALAVLFVMLQAQFIGVIQVMIYAGAIVVLFLFVIMLLNLTGGRMGAESQFFMKAIGAVVMLGASVQLVTILRGFRRPWPEVDEAYGTVREIGRILYSDYVLAFEVAGILLLAGVVGAVILAKRRIDP